MNKNQLQKLIYDYNWQSKEYLRIERLLNKIDGPTGVKTTQYGIEATLPKSNTSVKSKVEIDNMGKREKRQYERYIKFKSNVEFVESLADYVDDERQLTVLDCMMDGMSFRSIASHLKVSRNKLSEIKDDLLNHLSQKCQKDQKSQL
jgi:DNA-binding NarL/FixJ family response regulator